MRQPLLAAALATLCLSTLACTGQVFDEGKPTGDDAGDASPGDASPAPDGSPTRDASPPSGPCPAQAPALGSACADEDLQCEYGQSEYPACDTVVQCSSGSWQSYPMGGVCPAPNPSSCPPTMAAANGSSCDPGPYGATSCFYPTGGCYCGSLGGPIPIEPDGGYPPQTWFCDDPGPGCPLPRPRIGSTCTDEGVSCQYLQCNFAQSCTGGVWVSQPEGCAVAGSAPKQ